MGASLRQVAKLIDIRGSLGHDRDLFFVELNGFDTHSDEGDVLASKLEAINTQLSLFVTELKAKGVTHVHVCGLAYDHAVCHTALAAAEAGFVTSVIDDACRGASEEGIEATKATLAAAAVSVLSSSDLANAIAGATIEAVEAAATPERKALAKQLLTERKDAFVHARHGEKQAGGGAADLPGLVQRRSYNQPVVSHSLIHRRGDEPISVLV